MRHEEIGREEQQRAVEPRRRNPDDGEGCLFELEPAAHDAAIILKMALPICHR